MAAITLAGLDALTAPAPEVTLLGLDMLTLGEPPPAVQLTGLDMETVEEEETPDPDDGPLTSAMDTVTITVGAVPPEAEPGFYFAVAGEWQLLQGVSSL